MDLNIATHFSQGGHYGAARFATLRELIRDSGATGIRDGLEWGRVETAKGVYDFSDFRENYLDAVDAAGLNSTLTLIASHNPLYDGGQTVTSQAGIAAFADFVAAVADRFPHIDTIDIGNEFNGLDTRFVSGAAATKDLAARAAVQTAILEAVHERLSESHPDIRISGGSLHSVATGYVKALAEAGAFAYMDALDIHPYGSDPVELAHHLARLNEVLDSLPQDQRPEIVVTEFARSADADDPLSNAGYLVKMAAVMADAGVSEASWYALLDEDYAGNADRGLYADAGTENDMASGYRFLAGLLADGATPEARAAGPGVELYELGQDTWLVWGSSQQVDSSGRDLVFRNAAGEVIDAPDRLSDSPVFVTGKAVEVTPQEGAGALLADSFYDFALEQDPEGPWSYLGLKIRGGTETEVALQVMDGQSQVAENWNPYLGNQWWRPFYMTAERVLPVGYNAQGTDERASIERFTADHAGRLDVVGSWSVDSASTDGVLVEIRVNGDTLLTQRVTADTVIALRGIAVETGDTVDFLIHDGGETAGDNTTRHIRVFEGDATQTTQALVEDHVVNDIIDSDTPAVTRVYEAPDWTLDTGDTAQRESAADAPLPEAPEALPAPALPDHAPDLATETLSTGTAGAETLRGGARNDAVHGLNGDDLILGLGGDDLLYGDGGNDRLFGQAGADQLHGGSGRDMLGGGNGDDWLYGGADNDVISGGSGDDVLAGGKGMDVLNGGEGADRFVFAPGSGRDNVLGFSLAEGDSLDLRAYGLDGVDQVSVTLSGSLGRISVESDGHWVEVAYLMNQQSPFDIETLDTAGALLI